MSKNTDRAYLNKAKDNHEYHILWIKREYPPYWDDCGWHYYRRGRRETKLLMFQYRQYRNWKHNRKTQYKMKKIFDAL